MTSDEIMHVLRLTAMSRVNHPDQQRFCEALEKVFARAEPAAPAELAERALPTMADIADGSVNPTETPLMASKRTRKPKAD
jgi:hypothetical protein